MSGLQRGPGNAEDWAHWLPLKGQHGPRGAAPHNRGLKEGLRGTISQGENLLEMNVGWESKGE